MTEFIKANFALPTSSKHNTQVSVIQEEENEFTMVVDDLDDDEADQSIVPEEVVAGECDRATTVMMMNKKAVERDTVKMVAKSMESALVPRSSTRTDRQVSYKQVIVDDISESNQAMNR